VAQLQEQVPQHKAVLILMVLTVIYSVKREKYPPYVNNKLEPNLIHLN
jgi:hypothetical protein